jgi:hypothetical protein
MAVGNFGRTTPAVRPRSHSLPRRPFYIEASPPGALGRVERLLLFTDLLAEVALVAQFLDLVDLGFQEIDVFLFVL